MLKLTYSSIMCRELFSDHLLNYRTCTCTIDFHKLRPICPCNLKPKINNPHYTVRIQFINRQPKPKKPTHFAKTRQTHCV